MENLQIKKHDYDYIKSDGIYKVEGDFIFMPDSYVLVSEFLSSVRHGGRIVVSDFNGNPVKDKDTPMATGYIAELTFCEIDQDITYTTDTKYVIVPGDINGDGAVDARDLMTLRRLSDNDQMLLGDRFSKLGIYSAAAGGKTDSAAVSKLEETLLTLPSRNHKITVNGNSISAYGISRPASCSPLWSALVNDLARTVKKYTGVDMPVVCDCSCGAKIVINNPCKDTVSEGYKITVEGNCLVINAADDELIYSALSRIISEIAAGDCDLNACSGNEKTGNYTLTYSDEFDSDELDTRVWGNCTWNPEARHSIFQIYDEENDKNITVEEANKLEPLVIQQDAEGVRIEDGKLLVSVCCSDPENYKTATFYTHQPVTQDRLYYRYGLLEIRAKLPKFPAMTALWSLGKVEIDLVEGSQKPGMTGYSFYSNVHMPNPKGEGRRIAHSYARYKARQFSTNENLTEDFHTYAYRWTPDVIEFSVDGNVFWTLELNEFDIDDIMAQSEQYIFTGASFASTFPGGKLMCAYGYDAKTINKWVAEGNKMPKETTLYVDYVRLYQDKTEKNSSLRITDDEK